MRLKETPVELLLADVPDWVVGVAPPPAGLLPPVPPMDPLFGFTEAEWVRVKNHQATAAARWAWLARHAPHVTSRQLWQRRRDLRTTR